MLGEGGTDLQKLQTAVREFQDREERRVDPKALRAVIDALEAEFATEVRCLQKAGDHLAEGMVTVVSWLSRSCGMSASSVADRLCVGAQLESLPMLAEALRSGEIGFQKAAVLCHLRERLGADQKDCYVEEEMLEHARQNSVANLRFLCRYAWHAANPDGFFNEAEADYSRRKLRMSMMADGMHVIDAVLDPVGGAAVRTALDALAKRRGPEDDRDHKQRMADALVEAMHHAMWEPSAMSSEPARATATLLGNGRASYDPFTKGVHVARSTTRRKQLTLEVIKRLESDEPLSRIRSGPLRAACVPARAPGELPRETLGGSGTNENADAQGVHVQSCVAERERGHGVASLSDERQHFVLTCAAFRADRTSFSLWDPRKSNPGMADLRSPG